jgi:hypothetical protein
MVGSLFMIVATLIICGVMWWALQQLLALAAPYIGEPFMTLIRIVMVVVLVLIVLWVLYQLLSISGVLTMGAPTSLPRLH